MKTAPKPKSARRLRRLSGASRASGAGTLRGERNRQRIELGEHVVADPLICHGKPTYKGTRIML